MAPVVASARVASGSFSKNKKARPVSIPAALSMSFKIPRSARSALEKSRSISPPMTPPLLSSSSSASSTTSFDSIEAASPVEANDTVRVRRLSQEFFFPNQKVFESAVPIVTRAKDIHLKDHPHVKGAFAEYERLYNADSLMTKDGRHMVRLL
ncbi:hypothetical protein BGZ54_005198 [Gamsiella multidivaricata]|nr:hypothetical protein BGZ54_005198 [Gamsiella multidivaricata]